MPSRAALPLAVVGLLVLGSSCAGCDPCAPPEATALDYSDENSWLCTGPDSATCRDGLAATAVLADGSFRQVPFTPADAPPVDCFYVYPTVDLRLRRGVHDDFANIAAQQRTVQAQAARLGAACAVHAPLYRQVTLGTYAASARDRDVCFDLAYSDVKRAFEHYLEKFNRGRGVVMIGHSQGGQNTSRLLQEFFDGGQALASQLVAALPLGWPVATAAGERTGGTFADLPLCASDDELGCVVAFRSFAEGESFPAPRGDFTEGEQVACTNPADLASDAPVRLRGAYLQRALPYIETPPGLPADAAPTLLYQDLFTARCVDDGGHGALQIAYAPAAGDGRANPVDFDAALLSGDSGTHVLDVQLALGDLVELVRVKGERYAAEQP
jgi:hypothetical protein